MEQGISLTSLADRVEIAPGVWMPRLGLGTYLAAQGRKVGADGQLYVYCSLDEKPDHYCSYSNVVLSTENMKTWKFHPDSFVTLGKLDMLPANDAILYAPDCQYRDGQYYLYFCQPGKIAIGVATSKSPTGPFSAASFLNVGKHLEIDPSTFIDDDGQAAVVKREEVREQAPAALLASAAAAASCGIETFQEFWRSISSAERTAIGSAEKERLKAVAGSAQ